MTNCWNPLRTVAQSEVNGWTIRLDPTLPSQSLILSKSRGPCWEALAVSPSSSHSLVPEEVYVRQQDLIARFGQSETDMFGFQIDWRLLERVGPFRVGIEVWVSVQTQLLDSSPRLSLHSKSGAPWTIWSHHDLIGMSGNHGQGDLASLDSGGRSGREPAALLSYSGSASCLWLIEPGDQGQLNWLTAPAEHKQHAELFGEFLEKGVIRRARMQLLVGPKSVHPKQVRLAYQQLLDRSLPLTA